MVFFGASGSGSTAHLEEALRAGHVGTWCLDLETGGLTYDAEYARLHGHDPSLPMPPAEVWQAWIHPEDLDAVLASMAKREGAVLAYRIIHGPEAPRYVLNRSIHMPGPTADHPGFRYGVTIDVTDVEFARAASRRSDEQFRLAFHRSPIGMMVMNTSAVRIEVNQALCAMLGRTREELLALTVEELNHADELDEDRELINQVMSGERDGYSRQKRFRHADGHWVWTEVNVSAISAPGVERQMISHVRDITVERRQHEELRFQAEHDQLTGLLNRRAFRDVVGRRLQEQEEIQGAFLMVDLDNFKYHNDTYGHARGDAILTAIAEALHDVVPEDALIGRLGGDEFAILVPTLALAEPTAKAILDVVTRTASAISPDPAHKVTASVGIVDFSGSTVDEIVSRADGAMYAAKHAGRNQISLAR